jgi:hypothetical protein
MVSVLRSGGLAPGEVALAGGDAGWPWGLPLSALNNSSSGSEGDPEVSAGLPGDDGGADAYQYGLADPMDDTVIDHSKHKRRSRPDDGLAIAAPSEMPRRCCDVAAAPWEGSARARARPANLT